MVDYPGHLAAVFLISGCNFRCGFCHNPELANAKAPTLEWAQVHDTCRRFQEQWVDGAVISGGEPTLAAGLVDLIQTLKSYHWAVKLDTNGSRPDVLKTVLPLVDYVAMDVKCGVDAYPQLTGFSEAERIERSVELIKRHACDYEFRTTVLPAFHDDCQMEAIGSLVEGAKRYVLQSFRPREDLPEEIWRAAPRTTTDRLHTIQEKLKSCAEHVVVSGV